MPIPSGKTKPLCKLLVYKAVSFYTCKHYDLKKETPLSIKRPKYLVNQPREAFKVWVAETQNPTSKILRGCRFVTFSSFLSANLSL
jgi:hypothetical protein